MRTYRSPRRWKLDLCRQPIEFTISTPDGSHRVTWHAGRLTLHAHDIRTEQVMRALGGKSCPCLLVLDALSGRTADWAFGADSLNRHRQALDYLATDPDYLG